MSIALQTFCFFLFYLFFSLHPIHFIPYIPLMDSLWNTLRCGLLDLHALRWFTSLAIYHGNTGKCIFMDEFVSSGECWVRVCAEVGGVSDLYNCDEVCFYLLTPNKKHFTKTPLESCWRVKNVLYRSLFLMWI